MQIELKSIKIQDLIGGYINDPDTGVKGYHGMSSVMTKSSNKPLWKPSSKAFRSTSCIGA